MSFLSNFKLNSEIVKLETSSLIELYTIDTASVIKDPFFNFQAIRYNFHPYNIRPEDSNAILEEDKQKGGIFYNGVMYYYYPIVVENFEVAGDGTLPRPTLRVSNIYPLIKDLTLNLGDLVGATVKRNRVFKKNLNGQSDPDATAHFEEDQYLISKKRIENKLYMEFDLVTFIEANNILLPRRQVLQDYCSHKYRGEGCEWIRAKIIDINNVLYGNADNEQGDQNLPTPIPWSNGAAYAVNAVVYHTVNGIKYYYLCKAAHTSSYVNRFDKQYWIVDECNHQLSGCKLRWITRISPNECLPFGGFPSSDRSVV